MRNVVDKGGFMRSVIAKENDRLTVVGYVTHDDHLAALNDMLRYEGRVGTVRHEGDPNTGLFTATYITATWTPERWASMGFESFMHEDGAVIAYPVGEPYVEPTPCPTCGHTPEY